MVINSYVITDILKIVDKISSYTLTTRPDITVYSLLVEPIEDIEPRTKKSMKIARFVTSPVLKVGDIVRDMSSDIKEISITIADVKVAHETDYLGLPTPSYLIHTDTFSKPFIVFDTSINENVPHAGQVMTVQICTTETNTEIYADEFPPPMWD